MGQITSSVLWNLIIKFFDEPLMPILHVILCIAI